VEVLAPLARSGVWQTAPVGGPEQDDYLNAVVLCELDATQAWARAQAAEQAAGRERAVRWGPRTLDVDVISAPPRCRPGSWCPTPGRASGPSCWRPGSRSTRRPSCPGPVPCETCCRPSGAQDVARRGDLAL
jgi:hypothetical protein